MSAKLKQSKRKQISNGEKIERAMKDADKFRKIIQRQHSLLTFDWFVSPAGHVWFLPFHKGRQLPDSVDFNLPVNDCTLRNIVSVYKVAAKKSKDPNIKEELWHSAVLAQQTVSKAGK